MVDIMLNGEPRTVEGGTVRDLVVGLALDPLRVAVEHNRAIVPRSLHEQTRIGDGDVIEIVHFVGGG